MLPMDPVHFPIIVVATEQMQRARREAEDARRLRAAGPGRRAVWQRAQALFRRVRGHGASGQRRWVAAWRWLLVLGIAGALAPLWPC